MRNKINRFGYLRLEYLKEYKPYLYTTLLMSGKLNNHLLCISLKCDVRYNFLMKTYVENDSRLSEVSKENNYFEWARLMNNYRLCAEEIIKKELIYI